VCFWELINAKLKTKGLGRLNGSQRCEHKKEHASRDYFGAQQIELRNSKGGMMERQNQKARAVGNYCQDTRELSQHWDSTS